MPTAFVTSVPISNASEWGDLGRFRFTRSGSTASPLTINVAPYTGFSAAPGVVASPSDYAAFGPTVTFPAGAQTVDLTVAAVDDAIPEPTERIAVQILSGPGYTSGGPSSPIDLADSDSKLTFNLGSTPGSVGYTIPWDSVNATQASQTLSLSDLQVTVAGQTFSAPGATIKFAYGGFVGVTFSVNTAGVANYPYNAISMAGNLTVTAVMRGTLNPVTTVAAIVNNEAKLDFSGIPVGKAFRMDIGIYDSDGVLMEGGTFQFAATETVADVVAALQRAFNGSDVELTVLPGNKVVFSSKKFSIRRIDFHFFDSANKPIAGGLKLLGRVGAVVVEQNDVELTI